MDIRTIGIMSPGDMGHSVGQVLKQHGFDIGTCLEGRSERTRRLALASGFNIAPDLSELVKKSDLIMSILVPSESKHLAMEVADSIRQVGKDIYFADCNAVSPNTALELSDVINNAGGRFIDGGIIGGPPTRGEKTRFYVSGEHASIMKCLDGKGITIKLVGDRIGQASGIKMCYASMTKGITALQTELMMAAEAMGLSEHLLAEFQNSQGAMIQRMERSIPSMPAKSRR